MIFLHDKDLATAYDSENEKYEEESRTLSFKRHNCEDIRNEVIMRKSFHKENRKLTLTVYYSTVCEGKLGGNITSFEYAWGDTINYRISARLFDNQVAPPIGSQ